MDGPLETVRDEDFVEYFLFFRKEDKDGDAEELVKHTNRLNTEVLELVDRLSDQYIWHKDRFNLIPRFCPSAELRQSFPDTSDGNYCDLSRLSTLSPFSPLLAIFIVACLLNKPLFFAFFFQSHDHKSEMNILDKHVLLLQNTKYLQYIH